MGKLRVYCLKTLNKLLIYPLGNTPSAPSVALGQEQVKMSAQSCWALANLTTVAVAQQGKIRQLEERMDVMREMLLVLEYMQENPLMVDKEETAVSDGSGKEFEVEENKVAIPVPVPDRLVPIEGVE